MLSKLSSRLSYANVVSTICLFIVLGGSAYAAASVITGKNVKNNSLTGKDVKNSSLTGGDVKNRSLTPKDFNGSVQGPRGDTGAQGPKGDAGAPGVDGATGSGLLSGVADGIPPEPAGMEGGGIATPTGYSMVSTTSIDARSVLSPGRALVARDLAVRTTGLMFDGASVKVELRSGFDPGSFTTVLTCTVTEAAPDHRSCHAAGPGTIPAATPLFILLTVTGGTSFPTDPEQVRWGIATEPAGP